MPLFYFTRLSENRKEYYFAEMPTKKPDGDCASSKSTGQGKSSASFNQDKGEILATFLSNYVKLSDHVRLCLDYCYIITFRYAVEKKELARLLLAACTVPEKPEEILEDVMNEIITDLIGMEMLKERFNCRFEVQVSELFNEFCLFEMDEQDFVDKAENLPVHAVIEDDGKNVPPNFRTLQIHSLFLITVERRRGYHFNSARGISRFYMEELCKLKSLVVLSLDGEVECLPDEVGGLVQLKYFRVTWSNIDDLPKTLSDLQKLQTLDLTSNRFKHLRELPIEILNLQQLRHLLMSHRMNNGEIRVPKGFRTMVNLQTCDGVYPGDGIAEELSCLVQLKRLGVRRVADDHACQLSAAIMKMENLISLSMKAERISFKSKKIDIFPEFDLFSPPPLVQELFLTGGLVEIPNWLASMENLTTLALANSRLLENPNSVLQFLPKLKHLNLWHAYEVKCIGKEFCEAGGFPNLETLSISSRTLVEWTEIVEGALPCLRSLSFRNCLLLRFLPEGLHNISTLEVLELLPVYNDILRRLEGEEFYKIKNIPDIVYMQI